MKTTSAAHVINELLTICNTFDICTSQAYDIHWLYQTVYTANLWSVPANYGLHAVVEARITMAVRNWYR